MKKEFIVTKNAPGAIGPYSQGISLGDLVFTSGQLPIDPATGKLVEGDVKVATTQVIRNVQGVLEAAGSSLDKVVKATVYLKDLGDFAAMNEVYSSFFTSDLPARTCFQVAKLPMDASVEIEVIAHR